MNSPTHAVSQRRTQPVGWSVSSVFLLALIAVGCESDPQAQSPPQTAPVAPAVVTSRLSDHLSVIPPEESSLHRPIVLVDVAAEVGIDFAYDTGQSGEWLMVESTGGGGGWLDFDRDGLSDVYFCQGGDPRREDEDQPLDVLIRRGTDGEYSPVAGRARIIERKYGQGVSVADYDDDGFDDVYVSNVGRNTLWRNLGDGTFEDATDVAGVGDPDWSTSTAWADLDGDGDLDLYVCNYAVYDVHDPRICTTRDGNRGVCDPLEVDGEPDTCYENLGDGQFRDVTREWGFDGTDDRSLGVVVLDLNDDARPDVFVANDVTANFLYLNEEPGRFRESGVAAGVAMNSLGSFQASMGVGLGDYDADGHPDLYCTHFTDDSNTLYHNLGGGAFEDVTRFVDLHQPTWQYLGFGTVFQDFNADGNLDLFVTNGHISDWRSLGSLWRMPGQLFTWQGERFVDLSQQAGPYLQRELLGRAVAVADPDSDGDPDLLVVHQHDRASLLRNDSDRGNWLNLKFIGRRSNRRGIGVRVTVHCGEWSRSGWLAGGTSYCCSHEPTIFLGLGDAAGPCRLDVEWPSGVRQIIRDVAINQTRTLLESATDVAAIDPPSAE